MTTDQSEDQAAPAATARSAALFALGLGVVALISSYTGWGGIVLGLITLVLAGIALWQELRRDQRGDRRRARRAQALIGAVLGVAAIVIGLYVGRDVLFGSPAADTGTFGVGKTLDECMTEARDTAILQRACQAQHQEEYDLRFPDPNTN